MSSGLPPASCCREYGNTFLNSKFFWLKKHSGYRSKCVLSYKYRRDSSSEDLKNKVKICLAIELYKYPKGKTSIQHPGEVRKTTTRELSSRGRKKKKKNMMTIVTNLEGMKLQGPCLEN